MKEYTLYNTYDMYSDENKAEALDNIVENMFFSVPEGGKLTVIDNYGVEVEVTREQLKKTVSTDAVYEEISEWYQTFFEDLLDVMDTIDCKCNGIIAVASIGRWNGRVMGYKEYDSLRDSMFGSGDDMRVYVDNHGNLRKSWSDHDGSSSCVIRQWKTDISEVQKDNFLNKVYNGKATAKDISRYTKSVGNLVKDYYGFE